MGNTAQQAYDAIKNLEAEGTLPLPEPAVTKFVGTFNAATGKFAFGIPTVQETTEETVEIGGKPVIIKQTLTVGKVDVAFAVDLSLRFIVQNPKGPILARVGGITVPAAPGQNSVTADVGNMVSVPLTGGALSVIDGSIFSGSAKADFHLHIIRPQLITAGALTIPALPITLIYAPPPGVQNQNFAEYSNMTSISSKISGSLTSSSSTKTADAYTLSDFAGKITELISGLAALESENKDLGAANKGIGLGLGLLFGFIGDTTDSTTNGLSTTTEHDLQTTDTDTTTYGTPPGLGPGLGDRFVYLRNVKIAWLIANGGLSYTVLGVDGIRAFPAQDLISDSDAIAASAGKITAGPQTGLDADSLTKLLALDPFVGNPSPVLLGPRFVQNDPASVGGNGTDAPNGDIFSVSHEVTTTDISTQITTTTSVSDYKPGWLVALFGGSPATENQMTFTSTLTVQNATDQKQTTTVTFFAGPNDPPYVVGLYFDRLFGTFAFTPLEWPVTGKPVLPRSDAHVTPVHAMAEE